MTLILPTQWVELWAQFDRRCFDLKQMARGEGVSCHDISTYMRMGLGCAALHHPAFTAWLAIRHGVTTYQGLRDLLCASDYWVKGETINTHTVDIERAGHVE